MKLTFKTLKGEVFHIEVQPQSSIAQVKAKIQQDRGIASETQKIVYKGKPIGDADNVGALGIKEGDFLVIMNTLKKPEPKPKQEAPKKQEPKPVPVETKQQTGPTNNQQKLTQLMLMGFEREKCVAALSAAFNNTDVAVDYLINGIPADLLSNQQAQQAPGNTEEVLRALISTPEFQTIREMLRDDPTSLNAVLEQIRGTSLPLYNMIAENPEIFQKVLLESFEDQAEGGEQGEDMQGEEQGEAIHLTHEQDAAIKRLMALGFPKIQAAQAFFACDKNEQLAANLLFDRLANGDMDVENPGQGGGQGEGDQDDDNLFN